MQAVARTEIYAATAEGRCDRPGALALAAEDADNAANGSFGPRAQQSGVGPAVLPEHGDLARLAAFGIGDLDDIACAECDHRGAAAAHAVPLDTGRQERQARLQEAGPISSQIYAGHL